MDEIAIASREDALVIADDYIITPGFTVQRTLAPGATITDVVNVLCTFMTDLKKRGTKRGR